MQRRACASSRQVSPIPPRTAPRRPSPSAQSASKPIAARWSILGPNASGKSTLLRLIAGVLKPLSGRIEVDGAEVTALEMRLRAQCIALVSQESELLFPLRVWEYVLQGRYPYGRRLRFESSDDCVLA